MKNNAAHKTQACLLGLLLVVLVAPASGADYGSAMVARVTSLYDGNIF